MCVVRASLGVGLGSFFAFLVGSAEDFDNWFDVSKLKQPEDVQ